MSVFLAILILLPLKATAVDIQQGDIRSLINQSLSVMPERDSNGFIAPGSTALAVFSQVFDKAAAGDYSDISSMVAPYGYEFFIFLHQGNVTDTLYVLRERSPIQRGWGTYIWRESGYERNVQVQVPHPLFDFNTPAIGIRAFLDYRMRFFLMAGTHRYANGDNSLVSDMARNSASVFQRAHERWGMAAALQVHGFNDANPIYDGYPQNIITNGTTSPPPVHYTVRDLLRARQYTAEVYDESTRDAVRLLAATQNPQGQWSAANSHVFLHIEMARDLRTIATHIGRVGEAFAGAFEPINAPLSGEYTVGTAANNNYGSLGDAFSALTARGVNGDVILLITGDIEEKNNIFLGFDPSPHRVTIRPAAGAEPVVRFTSRQNNAAINGVFVIGASGDNANALTTTRNIIIDGSSIPGEDNRNLTFEITAEAGNSGYFRITGDVQDVTIKNTVFRSFNDAFDTWFISPVVSSSEQLFPRNITFENNRITGNPDRSSGRAIIVWAQNGASVGPRNLIIRNNHLEARRYGIWFRVSGGSTTIDGNHISITETIATDAYGIRIDDLPDSSDDISISNNLITGSSAGDFTGILFATPGNYTVHANELNSVTAAGLATGLDIQASGSYVLSSNYLRDFNGGAGVEMISSASGIDGDVDIYMVNNRLTGFGSTGTSGANLFGVIARSPTAPNTIRLTMYHNTIRLNPLQVTGSGWEYRGLSLFSNARISALLRNNIFINDDDNESGVTSYAYFQGGSAASSLDSDFNIFGGSSLSSESATWLVRHGSEATNTIDLSGFQSASNGDASSEQINIFFDDDLRPDQSFRDVPGIRGTTLTSVGTDALGVNRSADAPVKGALEFETPTSYSPEAVQMPQVLSLEQNYPNPFNPSTVITYSIAETGQVRLDVYDMMGRRVATLVNAIQSPGRYQVRFDANRLAAGVYLYTIQSQNERASRMMLLVK